MKLTPKEREILTALAGFHSQDREPDHHRIAVICGKEYSAADWAHAPLRSLLKKGCVTAIGKSSPYGGRRWKINERGRQALTTGCPPHG